MRKSPTPITLLGDIVERPDDPHGVMLHANAYYGGKALIVLGGPSGEKWERVRDDVRPDVILGANGVNAKISNLDYWMCAENMTRSSKLADQGDQRSQDLMDMFYRDTGKAVRLVSHRSWQLLRDTAGCVRIRRRGYELGEFPLDFTLREYGEGYLWGWMMKKTDALHKSIRTHVGTVGVHLLHHAAILGCIEVHTIGFDLKFPGTSSLHHWYKHPPYMPDRFRTSKMFTEYKGVKTQWDWIEAAQFLKSVEPIFERDGLRWKDHSNGLLSLEGLKCAV